MRACRVYHIDAFSNTPNRGNPAGVVVNADGLDDAAMLRIAAAVGFNETVFVFPSARADHRFRFFTPGHEMPLCGHATVAAAFCLGREGGGTREFRIETLAGVLPVSYDAEKGLVSMRQAAPEFKAFSGTAAELGAVLGVDAEELAPELPVLYGSTGTWTLLVPVRNERALFAMRPETPRFPLILREMPRASIHPFVVKRNGDGPDFIARHFSSPYSGTVEDPVTGTASGVMGAYAMRYLCPDAEEGRFVVMQGASVGRDGRVFVHARREGETMRISIAGAAVDVAVLSIAY